MTYGQRMMAVLVPRHFRTITELQHATKLAYSTLSDWNTGKTEPSFEGIDRVVEALRQRGVITTTGQLVDGVVSR